MVTAIKAACIYHGSRDSSVSMGSIRGRLGILSLSQCVQTNSGTHLASILWVPARIFLRGDKMAGV